MNDKERKEEIEDLMGSPTPARMRRIVARQFRYVPTYIEIFDSYFGDLPLNILFIERSQKYTEHLDRLHKEELAEVNRRWESQMLGAMDDSNSIAREETRINKELNTNLAAANAENERLKAEIAGLRAELSTFEKIIEKVSGLERCVFNVESQSDCNFCLFPTGAVFASLHYGDVVEANYYVCEQCLPAHIKKHCGEIIDNDLRCDNAMLSEENARLRAELGRMKSFHTCKIHGDTRWQEWGCPECVRELCAELESVGRWIPVEERLPDEQDAGFYRGEYLVTVEDRYRNRRVCEGYWNSTWNDFDLHTNGKAIAWQYTPEPYRPKAKANET
ncbi:MAG TPA: hypothetical protein PLX39_15365 [Pyrinomonadaceae bacterium]|nr:hypothetical protein [Pyrinomonadaceae bacterium]